MSHDATFTVASPAGLLRDAKRGTGPFGARKDGPWQLEALLQLPLTREGLPEQPLPSLDAWQAAMPELLRQTERDAPAEAWLRFKNDEAGTVAAGEVSGISIVAKRPRRTRASQRFIDLLRPARARRTWLKTWQLLTLGLPTEVPVLLAERKDRGLTRDHLIVCLRVPGETLKAIEVDALPAAARSDLYRETGRVLRQSRDLGFAHIDAKTSNWIACDVGDGLRPIMIDCDGLRRLPRPLVGIRRLLLAMQRHPDYRVSDAADVVRGFSGSHREGRLTRLLRREFPSVAEELGR